MNQSPVTSHRSPIRRRAPKTFLTMSLDVARLLAGALYLPSGRLGTGLAAAARIDHSEQHRSPTRNTPQPRAFRGTDAKEFPVLQRFLNELLSLFLQQKEQKRGQTTFLKPVP